MCHGVGCACGLVGLCVMLTMWTCCHGDRNDEMVEEQDDACLENKTPQAVKEGHQHNRDFSKWAKLEAMM